MPNKKRENVSQFGHGKLSSRSNKFIEEAQENPDSDTEEGKDKLTANFHQKNIRKEDAKGVDGTVNADDRRVNKA